ncbi:MAG: FecR domain-containing protein [Pseudomonas sp.]
MPASQSPKREEIRQQAATWVVRLSDSAGIDAAERARFESWRDQGPEHELAYERELACWEALDALRPDAAGDTVAPTRRHRRAYLPRWASAAGVVALLAGTFWWGELTSPAYATTLGERRVVRLEDGSRVELNTDSKIVVSYRDDRREVRLVRGEALFDIVRETRPFIVTANATRLVGTPSAMNVRVREGGTTVTVTQGEVEVRSAAARAPTFLHRNQEGWYTPHSATRYTVNDEDVKRLLAWRQDAIVLDGRSLEQIAQEFNRYNARKLVVEDPSITALRLAGYFKTQDIDGFVQAASNAFPIKAIHTRNGDIHLSRDGTNGQRPK